MPGTVLFQLGGAGLGQMVQNLQSMGVFLYILPFLLALAIFYGAISIAFKDKMQKSAMGLISIVLAFFVMLYSAWNPTIVMFLASLSGSGLLIASGVLFVIIVFSLIGFDFKTIFLGKEGKGVNWISVLAVVFVFILIFFGAGAGNLLPLPSWSGSSELWTAIFFIAVIGMAMWWMTRKEG
jgi:hypothetical protein